MKLITAAIRKKLEKNNAIVCATGQSVPVELKLFGGSCMTWLVTDIEADGDTLNCLADIGQGCCEFGTVSLSELEGIKFPPFGLSVERDMHFETGDSVDSFRKYYNEHGSLNGC